MKIVFKNGKEIKVDQKIVESIGKMILQGAKQWQVFTDVNGEIFLIVNLNEVAYIDN